MKPFINYILFCMSCGFISAQSSALLPIVKNGKWGAINERGVVVIHPKFNKIEKFFRNEAVAFSENKRGVINEHGEWVVNPIYDRIVIVDYKGMNAYKVWLNGKCGLLNKKHEFILSIKYNEISLQDDFYFFRLKSSWQIGTVDKENVLTQLSFDKIVKATQFFIGINGDTNSIVTFNGEVIETNCKFFIEKNQLVIGVDSSFLPQFFFTNGEKVFNEQYQFEPKVTGYFSRNLSNLKKNIINKLNVIDNEFVLKKPNFTGIYSSINKKWLVKGNYDKVSRLTSSLFLVYKNDLIRLVDSLGNLMGKLDADNIFLLGNYIVWEKDEVFGLYDENFKEVLAPKMNNLILQSNNSVYYLYEGKYGIVDSKSKVVSKPIFNSIVKQGKSFKAYTDDYIEIFDFTDQGVYLSEKKFTNVVVIKSKMEFPKLESVNKDQFGSIASKELGYGWYLDSIPYTSLDRPFDTLYAKKWGMKNELDSTVLKPKYYNPTVLSANFSLARIMKLSTQKPKEIPTENTLPYNKIMDIVDNVSQRKVNKLPFFQLNFKDTNSVKFISFLNKKGLGIVDSNYRIIRNDISFVDEMNNEATRFCVGATEILYDTISKESISSYFFWTRNEAVFSNEMNDGLPEKSHVHFKGAKWGFLKNDGTELFEPQFRFVENFENDVAFVCNDNWGAVNKDSIIIPLIFNEIKRVKITDNELYLVKTTPKKNTVFYDTLAQPVILEYTVVKVLEEGCLLVRAKQGYGILDKDKNWLLKPSLKRIPDCKGDYCIVKDGKYGVINFEGNQLVDFKYDDIAYYLGEGLVAINKFGKYGVGNSEGEVIIQPSASSVMIENNIIKMISNGSVKLYDLSGKLISKKKCDYSDYNVTKGLLMKVNKGKTTILNVSTQKKIKVIHKTCVRFEKELLIVKDTRQSALIGAINIEGKSILPTIYNEIKSINDTVLLVTKDNKVGLFSVTGTQILPCNYKKIVQVFDGLSAAIGQGKVKVFNLNGSLLYSVPGSDVIVCNDKLIMVKTLKSVTFINDNFENQFNETFLDGFPFSNRYTSVLSKDGWVILGIDGQILCSGMINKIIPKGNNLFQKPEISYLGLYNENGKVILEPIYDKIECVNQNCIRCERNGKIGYIKINGDWIYKME